MSNFISESTIDAPSQPQSGTANESLLDNPIWNTLNTSLSHLAIGNQDARIFPAAISPLAGIREPSDHCLQALARLLPPDSVAVLFLDEQPTAPAGTKTIRTMSLHQMVWSGTSLADLPTPVTRPALSGEQEEFVILGASDVPEMLDLTTLTNPGPFAERTHEFGVYRGIRVNGRLAAMAGERERLPGYTEVSAVCTHPGFRGRGYAPALMAAVMRGIVERGETPFLHVIEENTSAIRVYEALGFRYRRSAQATALRKDNSPT